MILRSSIAGALALAGLIVSSMPVEARHHAVRHHHVRGAVHATRPAGVHCDDRFIWTCDVRGPQSSHRPRAGAAARTIDRGEVVAHPAGCPRVAFCGCGAAVRIFHAPVRGLWLAAAWLKFPRAEPAPGMAAVRQHHVMVIEQYLGDGRALVYDANSGGHLTRLHVRSLAGYRIVNPRPS